MKRFIVLYIATPKALASMAGALQLVEDHPFYGYGEGCGIEVHEAVDM